MARSVYGYELCDPDFSWLITNFLDNNPEYLLVEQDILPLVFVGFKADQPRNNGIVQPPGFNSSVVDTTVPEPGKKI